MICSPRLNLVDELGNDPLHARQIVVITAVDIAEAEDQVAQIIALGIRVNQRLRRISCWPSKGFP